MDNNFNQGQQGNQQMQIGYPQQVNQQPYAGQQPNPQMQQTNQQFNQQMQQGYAGQPNPGYPQMQQGYNQAQPYNTGYQGGYNQQGNMDVNQSNNMSSPNNYNTGNNNTYNNSNGNAPSSTSGGTGGKGNKGLIIALVSVIAVVVILAIVLIVVLVKKNKDDDDTTETTTTTTETTTTEATTTEATTTEATTEETTEATTEEPAPLPYAEENGLTFSPLSNDYSLTTYTFPLDHETHEDLSSDIAEGIPTPAQFTFGEITRTEPDENGYVTITIPYSISTNSDVLLKSDVNFSAHCYFWFLDLHDYYTGLIFNHELNNETLEFTEITWDEKTYNIGVSEAVESNNDSGYTLVEEQEGGNLYRRNFTYNITITIYAPADYDGLVLRGYRDDYIQAYDDAWNIYKASEEYNEDTAAPQQYILGPDAVGWTFTPDQLYLIRVSDYLN